MNEMSGMNGMNFHSSGMILNVSEWGERQFHDVINCITILPVYKTRCQCNFAFLAHVILDEITKKKKTQDVCNNDEKVNFL